MNIFRLSIIALSLTLMFSIGSSATATTNYTHPTFSVTEDQTLSLRETGSQIVIDTIEHALRWGGTELFDERFQFDSSVNWDFSEGLEGELDALIPLWERNGHAVFTQTGIVFWSGIEEERRIDANLGAVYRTEVFDGIIGGVNLFYDHDLEIGHSRLGFGVDAQKDSFYGAFNYYLPLSDTQDGREGYVEDALEGMDAILGIESEAVRFSGNVGYWNYQGDENTEDEMEFSYGVDGGIRIFPGFFLEGSLQQHDDASIGRRASVGVAVRFSLPDLTGKSYGDNGKVSNLYKFVERERRILYEERVTGPRVSIVRTGTEAIVADEEVTILVDVQLSEALAENVTINLVGSGTATYGGDYMVSVGGTNCTGITEDDCQVTITAGQLSPGDDQDVEIIILDDGRTNEEDESIVLSMVVASPANTDLLPRGSVALTIPADPPLPTVSWSVDSTSIEEGDTATITFTLSEELESDATFNLIGAGGTADVTYGVSNDWHLSVGGTDCSTAGVTNPCVVTIVDGTTTATATVNVNTDSNNETTAETFSVSVVIDSGSTGIVTTGSSSTLNFTIPAELPTVTISRTGGSNLTAGGNDVRARIDLSEALTQSVTLNIVASGTADYGALGDWEFQYNALSPGRTPPSSFAGTNCDNGNCQVEVVAGRTVVDLLITTHGTGIGDNFTLSVEIPMSSESLVQLGNPSSLTYNLISP